MLMLYCHSAELVNCSTRSRGNAKCNGNALNVIKVMLVLCNVTNLALKVMVM